jgi:3-carboxy-cis,cis-muconate cycloisomerase
LTFSSIFVPDDLAAAVSDAAWLRAMLDAETALAAAQADVGLITADDAAAVAAAARPDIMGPALDRADWGRAAANPVVPLAAALKERAPAAHKDATSQDILDTAAMLVARRARALIVDQLDGVVGACARLAREHRATVMAGRTLMQAAQPITFGLKAAGWLSGVATAREGLREAELAAQLGGPVGIQTPALIARFAERLELAAALDRKSVV